MSSPLAMLKKTRRAPLHDPQGGHGGGQKVPFRRNLLKEFRAELADDEKSTPAEASTSKGAAPSDFELMSAMMQRVTLLEKTVRSQSQEIELKDQMISDLKAKRRSRKESESSQDQSDRDDLERRCQQLQQQVCEMETFLGDYGLIWVGDREGDDSAETELPHGSERGVWQPDTPAARGFHMNFDLVLERIRDLNVAGDGECFIRPTATGAQLAKQDPVPLSLYSNGILMFNGPFRSYQERSTQRCMQDLMDGYFPSELEDRFPDGAPFEVHDRRDEEFISRQPWEKFPGEGQTVRGERDESSNALSSQEPGKELSADQRLSRLPKVIVKAGRVIDIRAPLRAILQDSPDAESSSSMILIDTPALQAMKARLQTITTDRPPSARDVIMLKVKSEDGNSTFILKMCLSETVGHLRQYLDKHRGDGLPGYDIISAYPKCLYDDDRQTLQSCGLKSNATLLLRKRKQPLT